MEDKFDLNNVCYQDSITIKDKEKIKDFYKSHIDFCKEDIIKFEEHYKDFNISNAIELVILVSDYYDNKITFSSYFLMNNNSKVYLNIRDRDMINWLKRFELIIE
ncbi:MAG: hypothetical protein IJ509_01245 [Bacilli bacterium]|nr:hypothetical protein [Bacilli bacterium]